MIKHTSFLLTLLSFYSVNVFSQCPNIDFTTVNTGSNMTLLITGDAASILNDIGNGALGVFYTDDSGLLICGGSATFEGSQCQIAAYGDDTTTPEKDGFYTGDAFIWKFQDINGNQFDLSTTSFDNLYSANGVQAISSISYTSIECEFLDVLGCTDITYVEFNSEANTDDGSCTNLIIQGCTDESSFNYSSEANIDDGSCEYFLGDSPNIDFNTVNSGSNMTLLITGDAASILNDIGNGALGVFYTDDSGLLICGGSATFEGSQCQIAAYGDDTTTPEKDGFYTGDAFIWKFQDINGNQFDLSTTSFDNLYSANGVQAISSISYTSIECEFLDVLGCTDITYVEFNSEANTDDGSCTNLIIQGCTDESSFNYNSEANIDDGSCIAVVFGCTDETALNFNSEANTDDSLCEFSLDQSCPSLDFSFINTGNSMTLMVTGVNSSLSGIGNGTIGVFFIDDFGVENCGGSTVFDGSSSFTFKIYGDDTFTSEKDGFYSGESLIWKFEDLTGNQFDILNSSDVNSFTGTLTFISSLSYSALVCEDIFGCTDPNYEEYNLNASTDDGSCLTLIVEGCTDSNAFNFDILANLDNGSCSFISLSLQGIMDFTIPNNSGNSGRGLHFIALDDISDLSIYGFGVANGSEGSDGLEYSFDAISVLSGEDIIILRNPSTMENYLGDCYSEFEHVLEFPSSTNVHNFNGDDAIELFMSGNLIETFGNVNIDGTGEDWEYLDSWVYKVNGEWTYGGVNCTDGSESTFNSNCIYPICLISGCTDEMAFNYNSEANTDDGTCIALIYGCTSESSINYSALANTNDGTCIDLINGCIDDSANNFNPIANQDDGSCTYESVNELCILPDFPQISDINTGINMSVLMTPTFFNNFPVLTPGAFIIAYSESNVCVGAAYVYADSLINGQASIALWGDDTTTDELDGMTDGESPSFQLVNGNNLYDISTEILTYSTNEFIPLLSSNITFKCSSQIINISGCMNYSAANYNEMATIDDGSCVFSVDLDFVVNNNTGSNATLLILEQTMPLLVDGITLSEGDLIGLFYNSDDGYICSDFQEWNQTSQFSLVAWGDDVTTVYQDGFLVGQNYYWAIQFSDSGESYFISANFQTEGENTYDTNQLSIIASFSAITYENIYGCTDSLFIEFNPMASIEDNSCTILKIEGCTDSAFLEFWNYDSISFNLYEFEITPNFDNGTCETIIEIGCMNPDYTNFCLLCNVSDSLACGDILIPGCIYETAFNFDPLANINDDSCDFPTCTDYQVSGFNIEYSSYLNEIVFTCQLVNTTSEVLFDPLFDIEFYDFSYFELSDSVYSENEIIFPGDTVTIQAMIINDLINSPPFVLLSGEISLIGNEGVTSNPIPVLCEYTFTELYLSTAHLGCTSTFAFNYDSTATIDNGSCLSYISTNVSELNAECEGDFGSAIIYLSGGQAPYSSSTQYESYSQIGVAPENLPIEFNSDGVAYMFGLLPGVYNVEVSDNTVLDTIFSFSILPPPSISVQANIQPNGLLSSTVLSGNPILYQWLLNGETVSGANQQNYSPVEIGEYQVYIQDEYGCGSYSNSVISTVSFFDLDIPSQYQFSLFPNPSNGIINLKFSGVNSPSEIILTNVLGEVIDQFSNPQGNENTRLSLGYLSEGVYLLICQFNGHKVVKRFVKEK